MTDYMKEAERLIDNIATTAFANALGEMPSTRHKEARAALLAHIQRGAVPEGWQVVPKEPTTGMCRAGLAERHDDLAKSIYAAMLAAAPAPDHFRDAAEMVAEPADPDPLHLSRILHELAGAASLCWEPRPTGVFDPQMAIQFVEQALAEIRSRMTPCAGR